MCSCRFCFQLCYVSNDTAIVCQLPAYNLSEAFLLSLIPNDTDYNLITTSDFSNEPLGSSSLAQLLVARSPSNYSGFLRKRRKRDVIAQYPSVSMENQNFSLAITVGVTLDGYNYYQDIKAAIPNIDYQLNANLPYFFSYYTPAGSYDPETNSAIQLYVRTVL